MSDTPSGVRDLFDGEEVREVLRDTFYGGAEEGRAPRKRRKKKRAKKKADHYEVICISLYNEDLARLDAKVRLLKDRGHRKMSRSALIRYALDTCDLDGLPKAY
ncbi:MAG TPA: hypothetical protein RMH99_02775 [Sandaracinaceae bacterium LLY-WYZ-13_1]|nr:hypothetical protein [Sandaracinaceae bacterium LLY-WYZ-13_1]